jgi:hypothetical protein
MAYESPTYTVLFKEGKYEVRHYRTFKTIATSRASLNGYSGFNDLFSYISGNNEQKTSIKMTVPVVNSFDDRGMSMEFVMPELHTNEPPTPRVDFLETKIYTSLIVGVFTFPGNPSQATVFEKKTRLQAWLAKHQYQEQKAWYFARYNGPFYPGILRRNEVWITLGNVDKDHKNEVDGGQL